MSAVIKVDDSNFESEVLESAQPVVVDFSATWCGPCKKLEPIVDEVARDFEDKVKVVKIDVESAPGTAAKFAILQVPTLLFIRDGQVKDEHKGLLSKPQLVDRVERVLQG